MNPTRLHADKPANGEGLASVNQVNQANAPDVPEDPGNSVPGPWQKAPATGPGKSRPCPFCNPDRRYIVLSNDLCYVRWDINPVSKGHLLIIPFRHVADFFDTTAEERYAITDLAAGGCRTLLQERFHPSGYNFGVNIGEAAGQVIGHVHCHLIPRYYGDAHSKPNGMRNVVPKITLTQHHLREFQGSGGDGT